MTVYNRPALPRIAYREAVYAQLRAAMLAALPAGLSTRDPDDLGIALIDGAAVVGDVLTFYTERLAQESYLRTATELVSVRELGRLIGYRPRPGVAAQTWLAFRVEPPPPEPPAPIAGVTPDYAVVDPIRKQHPPPSTVDVPAGTQVRAVPVTASMSLPPVFETIEPLRAEVAWNALRAGNTMPQALSRATGLRIAGVATPLRPGDVLYFASGADFEIRRVKAVTREQTAGYTRVSWDEALALTGNPKAWVMRRQAAIFGHNAPRGPKPFDIGAEDWPDLVPAPAAPMAIDLDGSCQDVLPYQAIVLSDGVELMRYTVGEVRELSRAQYGLSGKVTRVDLGRPLDYWQDKVRQTVVYAAPEPLTLLDDADTSVVEGASMAVNAAPGSLPRRVLVSDGKNAESATVIRRGTTTEGRHTIYFESGLANRFERQSTVVYGNVAMATHGETVAQVLGDGDATLAGAAFLLRDGPLTHVGTQSTLEVNVNETRWHEVSSLYPAGPADRVFATRTNDTGTVVVTFGDGQHGSRLPTGSHNVRAKYRKGIGEVGNVGAATLTQLTSPPLGVTAVTNPAPGTGGQDPENVGLARVNTPLRALTLGRAVSLTDYADFARAYPGIAKAHAAVLPLAGGRTIVVTVAGPEGNAVPPSTLEGLVGELRAQGDPFVRVETIAYAPQSLTLTAWIKPDPDRDRAAVFTAVAVALRTAYSFDAREFGQPVHDSEVYAVIQGVPGVVALKLNPVLGRASLPRVRSGRPVPAQLLYLRDDPLPWLGVMA